MKAVPLPGMEDELREQMNTVAKLSRAEEGCLQYELFVDRSGSPDLYFLGAWADQKSLDAHNQTDHVKRFRNVQPQLAKELLVVVLAKI